MSRKEDEISPAMVREYLASGGALCPYCGSDEIEAGPSRRTASTIIESDSWLRG